MGKSMSRSETQPLWLKGSGTLCTQGQVDVTLGDATITADATVLTLGQSSGSYDGRGHYYPGPW